MWCQIVGKIRLAQSPWINHSWHATFYLTARGMTTSPIPYGARTFEIEFDFIDHHAAHQHQRCGEPGPWRCKPRPVADFYRELFAQLADLGLRGAHPCHAERSAGRHPVRAGHGARLLRWRGRQPVLAHAAAGRAGVQRIPLRLHRQVQSGAPVLGRPRPGGDAVFGRRGADASGRHPELPRLGHARGVLARSEQLRLLAWQRGDAVLRCSTPTPIPSRRASGPRRCGRTGVLRRPISANSSCRTTRCGGRASPDAMLLEFLQSTYEAAADLGKWPRGAGRAATNTASLQHS